MQALLFKKDSKWRELVYTCFGETNDISETIEDSDAENTKKNKENTLYLVCIENIMI